MAAVSFQTHPDRYRHWRLELDGPIARLVMAVKENETFSPGYVLRLNSYDLGVDIELADAIQRVRFEHPSVRVLVITGDRDKIFCAGANIHMLAASDHGFKVNFCKFTNETRLSLEDASQHSGLKTLAAVNGACAGGGYELALACDEILLVDDGSSAVSLPEVPLLAVLPGTGGLTRLVDKRKVRRDRADVFSTLAEGMRGARAVAWRIVDAVAPRSRFAQEVTDRAQAMAKAASPRSGPGVPLAPLTPKTDGHVTTWEHVTLTLEPETRLARLVVRAPTLAPPSGDKCRTSSFWPLQAFREFDDALLQLRFAHPDIGLVVVETRGASTHLAAYDALLSNKDDWFLNEVRLQIARTFRRMDTTAKSFFAVVDTESCFHGVLGELLLTVDRSYMLDAGGVSVSLGALSAGALPMAHGMTRCAVRFLGEPHLAENAAVLAKSGTVLDPGAADAAGLVTFVADDIDFEDEVRVAVEERCSLSPDALTGMEQNLRFAGNETTDLKIFGRLSAWQNWIFIRDNATGDNGALTLYGKPERPKFDWART